MLLREFFQTDSSGGDTFISKRLCPTVHSFFLHCCTQTGGSAVWTGWTPACHSLRRLLGRHATLGPTTHVFLNKQAYRSYNQVIYGEESAQDQDLWEVLLEESNKRLSFCQSPICHLFFGGVEIKESSILSQIEEGNLVTLRPTD